MTIHASFLTAALRMHSGRALARDLAGAYRSRFHGSGQEFAEMTEYTDGADARTIDWKASTRRGRELARVYEEERSVRMVFCADIGDTMRTQPIGKRGAWNVLTDIWHMLSGVALQNRDRIGMLGFDSASVHGFLPLPQAAEAMARGEKLLNEHLDTTNYTTGAGDIDKLITSLTHTHRLRRHLVCIVSDALEVQSTDALRALARTNSVIWVSVYAKPTTQTAMTNSGIMWWGTKAKEDIDTKNQEALNRLGKLCMGMNICHGIITPTENVGAKLLQIIGRAHGR